MHLTKFHRTISDFAAAPQWSSSRGFFACLPPKSYTCCYVLCHPHLILVVVYEYIFVQFAGMLSDRAAVYLYTTDLAKHSLTFSYITRPISN